MPDESSRGGEISPKEQIIVLIIPDEEYSEKVLKVTQELSNIAGNICYVSLNRPYNTLLDILADAGVDTSKFYFIDGITKTAELAEECENCTFVSSAGALTELSLALANLLDERKFDFLLFDSLSTLLVYEEEVVVTKFVHSLMAKVRVSNCRGVFTCLKRDLDSVLIKDINMFADKVVDIQHWGLRGD